MSLLILDSELNPGICETRVTNKKTGAMEHPEVSTAPAYSLTSPREWRVALYPVIRRERFKLSWDSPAQLDRLPEFDYYAKLRVYCKEIVCFRYDGPN